MVEQEKPEKEGLKDIFLAMGAVISHLNIMGNREDEAEWRKAEEAGEEIIRFAIKCGGTASGEHGIGVGKKKFMKSEHGQSLSVMKQIKDCLDPNGIMNPGKIFE
jgi:D-lactate dehydrogenase (cytochrome)